MTVLVQAKLLMSKKYLLSMKSQWTWSTLSICLGESIQRFCNGFNLDLVRPSDTDQIQIRYRSDTESRLISLIKPAGYDSINRGKDLDNDMVPTSRERTWHLLQRIEYDTYFKGLNMLPTSKD